MQDYLNAGISIARKLTPSIWVSGLRTMANNEQTGSTHHFGRSSGTLLGLLSRIPVGQKQREVVPFSRPYPHTRQFHRGARVQAIPILRREMQARDVSAFNSTTRSVGGARTRDEFGPRQWKFTAWRWLRGRSRQFRAAALVPSQEQQLCH
jgi:hypothetical protein